MSFASASSQTFCVIRSGAALYGLPTVSVCEVLEWHAPSRVPLAPIHVAGVIVYQGDVLTVICLRSLLDQNASGCAGAFVVLEDPLTGERFALAVDAVEQVLSIPNADIEPNPQTLSPKFDAMFTGICHCHAELLVLLNLSSVTPDTLFEEHGPPERTACKGERGEH